MPPPLIRLPRWDAGFLALFLAVFAWLLLFTIPDYGVMWDAWEYHIGDRNLRFWTSLDLGALDVRRDDWALYHRFSHPNFHGITNSYQDSDALLYPYMIWPLGPLSSSVSKVFLHIGFGVDAYDAHHAILVPWLLLLFSALWCLARPRLGRWPAVTALLVVACYPRFWAECHNNIKDIPSAALMTATLALGMTAVERQAWRRLLLAGVVWGLALAAKPNGLFLPFIGLAWLVAELWRQRRAGRPLARWFWPLLLALPLVAVATMLAVWPLLWVDFPTQFLVYLKSLMSRGYTGEARWQLMPLINAVATMPLPVLLLVGVGLVSLVRQWRRRTWQPVHLLALA